ncbi:outer membrane protein assembly factor BamB family protein [Gordonia sp. HS-NH1]|uniref:outer membrane protein assembly factor BamB family protein n=1 Tax=Gordonia sp. HS-NH1 TaxID=1435068 RepID=UPI0012E0D646|nr:PQQ-binding-like beta-propeller repeat protein [Gordonia sp. HS-NH1]
MIAVVMATVVISAIGVTATFMSRDSDRGREPASWSPPDLGSVPSLAWSLHAERVPGHNGEALLSLPDTLDAYYGYVSVLDAPTVIVGALGRLAAENENKVDEGRRVESVTLVGLHRVDGSTQWERPIGRVRECSDRVESGVIACWNDERVLFVNTADGRLLSETSTAMANVDVMMAGDRAYVTGIESQGARHNLVVSAGPPSAPGSTFRRSVPVAGPLSGIADVLPSGEVVVVTNLEDAAMFRFTVHDFETGRTRFNLDSTQLTVVGDGLFLNSPVMVDGGSRQQILDGQGTLVSTAEVPAYTHSGMAEATTEKPPVMMADGAYDPESGRLLWRNPLLLRTDNTGAVQALAGRTVIVAAQETGELIGFDSATGEQRWRTPWRDAYWVYGGMTDGRHYVFSDYAGFHALRIADGAVVWSRPLPEGADPRQTTIINAGGNILITGNATISMWRGDALSP